MNRRLLIVLFLIGLLVRVVGLFGLGDADMEHFKAWAMITRSHGLPAMYSVSDAELLADSQRRQVSIVDSFNTLRTRVRFAPLAGYWRSEYMVMYPPGSVYLLHLSGMAYSLISPDMENGRLFNVFISLPMLLASLVNSWVIYVFLKRENPTLAVATTLVYWLNPIVLLDSTIQGYNNPIIVLLFLLALMCLYRRYYLLAVCVAVLSVWVKPQGTLLVLLTGVVCLKETKPRMWLLYLLAGIGTSLVVLWPFVIPGYAASALLGATATVRSLGEWSVEVLSARAWNVWWPIQLVVRYLWGADPTKLAEFKSRFGVDARLLGSVIMLLVSGLSLAKMFMELPVRRIYVFLCAVMLAYAYTMVQVNVQYNQFFMLIPILLLVSLANRRLFAMTVVVSTPWALQLLAYGGLGRDVCCIPGLFTRFGLGFAFIGIALLISLINVAIWVSFSWQYFSGRFTAPGDRLLLGTED